MDSQEPLNHLEIGNDPVVLDAVNNSPESDCGAESSPALTWEPITVVRGHIVLHPFLLKQENWMDEMLVRTMIVYQPFATIPDAGGKKRMLSSWTECATALSKTEDPTGNLVYGHQGVSDKEIKKRFYDLMGFVQTVDHDFSPFQCELDDQRGPGLLLRGMEDLYGIYSDYLSSVGDETEIVSTGSYAKKVLENKARDEAMCNAAMGMLTAKDKAVLGIVKKRYGGGGGRTRGEGQA